MEKGVNTTGQINQIMKIILLRDSFIKTVKWFIFETLIPKLPTKSVDISGLKGGSLPKGVLQECINLPITANCVPVNFNTTNSEGNHSNMPSPHYQLTNATKKGKKGQNKY